MGSRWDQVGPDGIRGGSRWDQVGPGGIRWVGTIGICGSLPCTETTSRTACQYIRDLARLTIVGPISSMGPICGWMLRSNVGAPHVAPCGAAVEPDRHSDDTMDPIHYTRDWAPITASQSLHKAATSIANELGEGEGRTMDQSRALCAIRCGFRAARTYTNTHIAAAPLVPRHREREELMDLPPL